MERPDLTTPSPVATLLEYKFNRFLGGGAAAAVYEATDLALQRTVAIKVLTKPNEKEAVRRFAREGLLMGRLDHPNLVAVHASGYARGMQFLVLQYVSGFSAFELVERLGPLPAAVAAEIALQASRGLLYAHENGVLHRDVKPSNLLVNRDGVVKVADFGISRDLDNESRITATNQILGTMNYVAPEQVAGDPADERSDIYALGATLHHLLSGVVPFRAETPTRVLMRRMDEEPPRLERGSGISGEICAQVGRMMAKDPRDRPASMAEVGVELLRACQGAEPFPSPLELSKLARQVEQSGPSGNRA